MIFTSSIDLIGFQLRSLDGNIWKPASLGGKKGGSSDTRRLMLDYVREDSVFCFSHDISYEKSISTSFQLENSKYMHGERILGIHLFIIIYF
jgi:hypothetical protein